MASEDERESVVGVGGGELSVAGGDALVEVTSPEELTILFVDDERQLLSIVASRLKEEVGALDVITASHGTEALERLDQLAVDCIISDYKMPGMDGLALLKKCRERDPDVPFILFTSKGSEDIATKAINADVTDYLQKNMGEEQFALLANRIENAVSEYRAKQIARDTYQHVRRIHDRVSDAYLGLDAEWQISYVDEAGAELLKDAREALLGESFWEVLPEAVGSPFETQFERAVETREPVNFETHYEPFDAWFEVRAFPAEDGLSVYFRDVTDLKEQGEALDRQCRRLDEVADAVADLGSVAGEVGAGVDVAREDCSCDGDPLDRVADAVADLDAVVADLERIADEE